MSGEYYLEALGSGSVTSCCVQWMFRMIHEGLSASGRLASWYNDQRCSSRNPSVDDHDSELEYQVVRPSTCAESLRGRDAPYLRGLRLRDAFTSPAVSMLRMGSSEDAVSGQSSVSRPDSRWDVVKRCATDIQQSRQHGFSTTINSRGLP